MKTYIEQHPFEKFPVDEPKVVGFHHPNESLYDNDEDDTQQERSQPIDHYQELSQPY